MAGKKRQKSKVYAVAKGRKCGIYNTWDECQTQTRGYTGAKFKSFSTLEEARLFINPKSSTTTKTATSATTSSTTTTTSAGGRRQKPAARIGINIQGKCYAVAKGHTPGIYPTWDICKRQTSKFSRPVFKKFDNGIDAAAFMSQHNEDWKRMAVGMEGAVPSTTMGLAGSTTIERRRRRRPTKSLWIQLWFDGGSRGNPGISGAGAHLIITMITSMPTSTNHHTTTTTTTTADDIVIVDKKVKVVDVRHYCGTHFTNNYAEYCGIREGLLVAKHYADEFCRRATDSQRHLGLGSGLTPTTDTNTATTAVGNDQDTDWNYTVEVDIKGDSNMIIEQLNGNYACHKATLKILYQECIGLIRGIRDKAKMATTTTSKKRKLTATATTTDDDHDRIFVEVHQEHVYRDKNKVADALANEAMDQKKSWQTVEGDSELLGSSNSSYEIV